MPPFRTEWRDCPPEDVWLWRRRGWTFHAIVKTRNPRNGGTVKVAVLRREIVIEVEDAAA